ncbi:5-dehydro-2-deoxygluconokinase [Pectinatus sottacetonis]|uniref:5-dehydro-2-deoxygluconokinase n=1 Tax=Pectinatus sottacetonis TaxID=1002795 RepID=UPI0018C5583D|nr:5-dehydro-2-deoxygluconokinase [Pectinatus sottacetonis]
MALLDFDEGKPMDVIPMGRATIDFNPNELNRTLDKVRTFTMYLGGSPANIAVGLAKLGKKVGFIGAVSDDQFGTFVESFFQERDIDTKYIVRVKNGAKLGLTFTEISSPVDSQILMYRNMAADLMISPEDVSEEYISNSKILLISGTALAARPSREACFMAMRYAREHGTKIIFDIDYRPYNWDSLSEVSIYYSLAGQMSDVIMGSREEFDLTENLQYGHNKVADHEIADKYIRLGNKIVIIKHGKKGSVAYGADKKAYKVDSYKVKLLKSFGGGDAYGSAFIYGLLEHWELPQCLRCATAHAAMVVASHSCSEAMQDIKSIYKFINERKDEQVIIPVDWKVIL